ncbi:unnamed protein product [Symbiodinium microadriaticum]|nr:unnamed protein product [Symbiodinium microadriaticum]
MLVILDMGSLFVGEVDGGVTMVICLIFSALMLLSIIAAVSYGIIKHFMLKYRKPFRYFLCHQKIQAGSYARLLKMECGKRGAKYYCFVDCDDLNDLTRLFSYVGQDSETFVILGSPDIMTRKWCVGEMVTARSHKVHSVLLMWPDFVKPDKIFIENYDSIVPDITELANYNIGLPEVRETLEWINTIETLDVPALLNPENISGVINGLTGTVRAKSVSHENMTPDCLIISDLDNMEDRRTVHEARAAGRKPPLAVIRRLAKHHSRPLYHEDPQMVRGQAKGQWREQQPAYGWRSQYGAKEHWGQEQRRREDREPRKPKEIVFPAYNKVTVAPKEQDNGASRTTDDLEGPGSFVRNVQKLVNAARKAEARVRKAEKESEDSDCQWQEFQAQLRKAFLRERARHQGDARRLAQEVEEQRELHQKALGELKRLLDGPQERPVKSDDESNGALDDWAKLTAAPDDAEDFLQALGIDEGATLSKGAKAKLVKILGIKSGVRPVRTVRPTEMPKDKLEPMEVELEGSGEEGKEPPFPFSPSTRTKPAPPAPKPGTKLADKLERRRAHAIDLLEDDDDEDDVDLVVEEAKDGEKETFVE